MSPTTLLQSLAQQALLQPACNALAVRVSRDDKTLLDYLDAPGHLTLRYAGDTSLDPDADPDSAAAAVDTEIHAYLALPIGLAPANANPAAVPPWATAAPLDTLHAIRAALLNCEINGDEGEATMRYQGCEPVTPPPREAMSFPAAQTYLLRFKIAHRLT
jgi:hypothetical protein